MPNGPVDDVERRTTRAIFCCPRLTKSPQMSKYHIDSNCLACLICRGFVMKNSRGGTGLVREERLQIMLSPEELKAVDNFRFHHRMPSRAAAVRELLRHGLAAAGVAVVENASVKSRDYGVLKAPKGVAPARSS